MSLIRSEGLSILKSAARTVLHRTGSIRFFRGRRKHAVRILMYHNFPPDVTGLRRQCEHIRRYYNPVSMREISDALHRGASLPQNAVAITVDDGYRDFLLYAHPVLAEFGIPSTVFLVTGFLDHQNLLWWDELQQALEQTRKTSVRWQACAERPALTVLRGQAKQQAYHIAQDLKELPNEERLKSIQTLVRLLDVPAPAVFTGEFAPMTWDEVRSLSTQQVEFGAHTRTHPILSAISAANDLRNEIAGSRDRLAAELNSPVLHFCYPNGRDQDIGPAVLSVTRECGFETAVTTIPGMTSLDQKPDPLLLKRIAVDPGQDLRYFAELLAGVRTS